MSFILDALRKSDAERQRTVAPGLADVRYAPRRSRRNVWLPVLVVVLAANAVFLAFQWLREEPAPATPPPAATDANPPANLAPVTPAADIRPLAREAEFGEPMLEPDMEDDFAVPPGPVTGPDAGPVPAPVVVEAAEPAPAPPAAVTAAPPQPPPRPSRIVPGDDLPTAEQLMGSGELNTPMLNLDLHVYSEAPAGRFVIINSRKYKEGGQLSEGPVVESITAEGVILSSRGRRFTLSRK